MNKIDKIDKAFLLTLVVLLGVSVFIGIKEAEVKTRQEKRLTVIEETISRLRMKEKWETYGGEYVSLGDMYGEYLASFCERNGKVYSEGNGEWRIVERLINDKN